MPQLQHLCNLVAQHGHQLEKRCGRRYSSANQAAFLRLGSKNESASHGQLSARVLHNTFKNVHDLYTLIQHFSTSQHAIIHTRHVCSDS